jgi:uncharacterized protein
MAKREELQQALWQRLDVPGHDACRLVERASGWLLQGNAVFLEENAPASLSYEVSCDPHWICQNARVHGFHGGRSLDLQIARDGAGRFTLNGVRSELPAALDLDLGFTPATNLIALRRLDLRVCHAADAPAAWLDLGADSLGLLEQRYERLGPNHYWYEAPRVPYAATLEVSAAGFIRSYPRLWQLVSSSS